MKNKICALVVSCMLLTLSLAGCTPASPTILGEWRLETVSAMDGTLTAVGKAYSGTGTADTVDVRLTFDKSGRFTLTGIGEGLSGGYYTDEKSSTDQVQAIRMNFSDSSETLAACGVRRYQEDQEQTLTFTYGGSLYVFLR